MRIFLGILAGIVVGFLVAAVMGITGEFLFPSGIRVERYTAEAAAEIFPRLPFAAQLISLLSWSFASLAGAALAKKIAGLAWANWTVAGFFTLYALVTLLILPAPGWMQVLALIGPVIGGFIANHIVAARIVTESPTEVPDDADV